VLAALYFWGRDIEDSSGKGFRNKRARDAAILNWNAAADDVLVVLSALAEKYAYVFLFPLFFSHSNVLFSDNYHLDTIHTCCPNTTMISFCIDN